MKIQNKKATVRTVGSAILLSGMLALGGCSALSTTIHHHALEVESKMSDTVFLDPVPERQKTIYVQVRNTTGETLPTLKQELEEQLEAGGWRIVHEVEKAHNMLQLNVLQAGEANSPESVWGAISGGYGSAISLGGLAGLAAGYHANNVGSGMAMGGIIGAGSWVADQLVSDVTWSVISDVQISIRTQGKVRQNAQANLHQGNSTQVSQSYQIESNWLRYHTRIASTANKMNLKFAEAKQPLAEKIARQVSGIFAG